jgi:hypothetical protein
MVAAQGACPSWAERAAELRHCNDDAIRKEGGVVISVAPKNGDYCKSYHMPVANTQLIKFDMAGFPSRQAAPVHQER